MDEQRTCKQCRESLPIGRFSVHHHKASDRPAWTDNVCKTCRNLNKKQTRPSRARVPRLIARVDIPAPQGKAYSGPTGAIVKTVRVQGDW